jgi:hypothetical protein
VFAETKGRKLTEPSHLDGGFLVDAEVGCGIGGMPKRFKGIRGRSASMRVNTQGRPD